MGQLSLEGFIIFWVPQREQIPCKSQYQWIFNNCFSPYQAHMPLAGSPIFHQPIAGLVCQSLATENINQNTTAQPISAPPEIQPSLMPRIFLSIAMVDFCSFSLKTSKKSCMYFYILPDCIMTVPICIVYVMGIFRRTALEHHKKQLRWCIKISTPANDLVLSLKILFSCTEGERIHVFRSFLESHDIVLPWCWWNNQPYYKMMSFVNDNAS